MYYYGYGDYSYGSGFWGGIMALLGFWIFIIFAIGIVMLIAKWKIYEKAGRSGWEAIVPIYSTVVMLQFLDLPIWLILLLFIPGANIAIPIITAVKLSERFGKETAFSIGLIFLPVIFYPILGFGDSTFK